MFFMSASPTDKYMPLPSLAFAFDCAFFAVFTGENTWLDWLSRCKL